MSINQEELLTKCPFCKNKFVNIPFGDENECPNCGETYRWTGWQSIIWSNEHKIKENIDGYK